MRRSAAPLLLATFLLGTGVGAVCGASQAERPNSEESAASERSGAVSADRDETATRDSDRPSRGSTADRWRSGLGAIAILGLALLLSEDRRAISIRTVGAGLALHVGLAIMLIQVPFGREAMQFASQGVVLILNCALTGAEFVFGPELTSSSGPVGFVFAFRILPTIIFVAALFAVGYQIGVMSLIVRGFAWCMAKTLGTSGAESLNTAASLFLGQTEAPLTIRPFLARLTESELMTVMVSGMALVAGGVLAAYIELGAGAGELMTAILLNAPAAIVMAKILVPETQRPETFGVVSHDAMPKDANVIDAAARGTREGLHLALNIAAVLITFIALITLVDFGLGWIGDRVAALSGGRWLSEGLSLSGILGGLLAPLAWLMGVPWSDSSEVGALLGTRLVLNEMVAYQQLGELSGVLGDRAYALATFALCGFANLSSIGIQVGGIGALVPERRGDLARLGLRALFAATLANFLTASLAGMMLV